MVRKCIEKEIEFLHSLKNHQNLGVKQCEQSDKTLINKEFFAGAKILNKK